MSLTVEKITIPNFIRTLNALSGILEKGAAYAEAKGIDPAVLVNARLAADMHPLKRQVQMVTDTTRRILCQLADQEVPAVDDTEETFTDLQARIKSTIEFVETFDASNLQGAEDKTITLPMGENGLDLDGVTFTMGFGIPNLYFHVATAYNILRHNGVEIGKMDFLGNP